MKANMRATFACLAMAASLSMVAAPVQAAEPRSKEQCSTLFNQLNTSGNGKLTMQEASKNSEVMPALTAPSVWKKGFLTVDEFTPLCVAPESAGPHG